VSAREIKKHRGRPLPEGDIIQALELVGILTSDGAVSRLCSIPMHHEQIDIRRAPSSGLGSPYADEAIRR
jgi:hypothetical protein